MQIDNLSVSFKFLFIYKFWMIVYYPEIYLTSVSLIKLINLYQGC